MNFDIAIIGFGVIGTETLFEISKNLKKKQKVKIAVIEKNINNIPGGVAYSKKNSRFGFFNNPLRLSSPEFINWIKKKQNIKKLIEFIKKNKNYNLDDWLTKNKDFKNVNIKNFDEIYFPRLTYSLFLEDKIKKIFSYLYKKNFSLFFFKGELTKIEKKKMIICNTKKKLTEYKPYINSDMITFKKKDIKRRSNFLSAANIILGNGLLPPKIINQNGNFKNSNYIWDFYSEGGTLNLINKINKIKSKKSINIVFIGNKAGLLETMPELENIITNKGVDIKIVTIAPNNLTLEKAEHSKNFESFKFKYLIKKNIKKIKKSDEILNILIKEFRTAKLMGFNKYDVWTWVLKNNLILDCYSQLSSVEKKKYNELIFPKIRNITRYTYPNTIYAKKRLERKKILQYIKDKVSKIKNFKDKIVIKTYKGKKITADILINVSGPVSLSNLNKEVSFIKYLKKMSNNYNYRGFIANKNFAIIKNIYAPGTISSNFNPNRLTIIKSVIQNSHKVSNEILKKLK